jgi:type IX secretion system PorP/SprF family membrane protein
MNKLYNIWLSLFLILSGGATAQDMHFTQFYSSPTYLNPAFAGSTGCTRMSITYRNQWPGISKAYKSYLVSGDHFIPEYNIGVGLLVGQDVAGSGSLKTTVINPMLSYQTRITKTLAMRVGFQPGIAIRTINFDKLLFGDQIARGGNIPTIESPPLTKTFFDIGSGVLFYTSKYWAGLSMYHLTQPDESLIDADAKLPIKYSVHGGAKFNLNEDEKDESQRQSVTTAFHYRGQKEFDQFDIGLYYTKSVFNLGLWYRGIPGLKAYKPGYSNNDAFSIIVGVTRDNMNIGYSYDITISKLAGLTNGAHELCLSYIVCKKKKKRRKMIVPCPKF